MRILILSDIHGNLVALETVLRDAAGAYDAIWCLGDVVGYGPRPSECTRIIAEQADLCVMGNHDWAVLGRPGVNVDEFNPHARQAVLWTRSIWMIQAGSIWPVLPISRSNRKSRRTYSLPMPVRASRYGSTF